jgi:hypothetical protein
MGAAAEMNDRAAAEGSGRVMTLRARGVIVISAFLAGLGLQGSKISRMEE